MTGIDGTWDAVLDILTGCLLLLMIAWTLPKEKRKEWAGFLFGFDDDLKRCFYWLVAAAVFALVFHFHHRP